MSTPVDITVRGSAGRRHRAERATVRFSLAAEDAAPAPAHAQVAEGLASVRASLEAITDADHGPVRAWSTGGPRTWVERPWSSEGPTAPVHHVAVSAEATFDDAVALAGWVAGHVAGTPGFVVDDVAWSLTDEVRERLEREARLGAVDDAARRAQTYADGLGLGPVRPLAVADAGLLGVGGHGGGVPEAPMLRMAAASAPGGDGALALEPDDVEVTALVEARFVAG